MIGHLLVLEGLGRILTATGGTVFVVRHGNTVGVAKIAEDLAFDIAGGWIHIRDAVKRKLPTDVPMPGSFRTGANGSAPAEAAPQVQEENA